MQDKPLALIIDDEADLCRLMQITLNKMGVDTHIAYDVASAKAFLADNHYNFCLTDLALPDGSGMEIVELITTTTTTPVAVITAHGDVNIAIEAMKIGAFDFVNKPLDLPRLRQLVQSALKVNEAVVKDNNDTKDSMAKQVPPPNPITGQLITPSTQDEPKKHLKKAKSVEPTNTPISDDDVFGGRLIGESRPMKHLRATIKKLARSQAPVFLWGGSGTGKEVVSRLIHDLSSRRDGSFVPVNCGAIPSELMESEFFGHKKGSFTGATSDKIGLFQQADGGTLFLDEVADLPLAMQVKLLRAIQEKTVRAIGDTKEVPVDIRIICATHKDLADLVQKGTFRQDLFYRINVIEVKLPALNERRDDIPMLAQHFLGLIAKDWGLDNLILTDDAIDALTYHDFKGNVRELRNILERAVTLSDSDEIDAHHLMLEDNQPKLESIDDEPITLLDADETKELTTLMPDESQTALGDSLPINSPMLDDTLVKNPIAYHHSTEESLNDKADKSSPYHDRRPTYAASAIIKENKSAKPVSQGLHISATANYGTPLGINNPKNEPAQDSLPTKKDEPSHTSEPNQPSKDTLPTEGLEVYLLEQERQLICTALQQAAGNKTQAAKLLGMTFRSLRYRMKKLEIEGDDGGDE